MIIHFSQWGYGFSQDKVQLKELVEVGRQSQDKETLFSRYTENPQYDREQGQDRPPLSSLTGENKMHYSMDFPKQ